MRKLVLILGLLILPVLAASSFVPPKNEHPLARDERIARKYVYQNREKGVRDMFKADGLLDVDIIKFGEDEAVLFKDQKTGEYVVAFRGTQMNKKEWYDNAIDTMSKESSVGEFAYLQMKDKLDKWVEKYAKHHKIRVVGHSKGGAMALHFTADNAAKISRTLALNAPGQSAQLCDQYEQKMKRLESRDQPEVVLAFATHDPVSDSGDNYIGGSKRRVIAATGHDMGVLETWSGHSAYFFSNPDTVGEDGKTLRKKDDARHIMEMTWEGWKPHRGTELTVPKDRDYSKSGKARTLIFGSGSKPVRSDWKDRFAPPPLIAKFDAPPLVNPSTHFEVVPTVVYGFPPLTYSWSLNGKPIKHTTATLQGTLDKPPGVYTFGVTVTDRRGRRTTATKAVELYGNSLTVTLKDAGTGKPVQGTVTARVYKNSVSQQVNGTRTFTIHVGPEVTVEVKAPGYTTVSKSAYLSGGEVSMEFELGGLAVNLKAVPNPLLQGERVKVEASVPDGLPPLATEWQLNGKPMPKGRNLVKVGGRLPDAGFHEFRIDVTDKEGNKGYGVLKVEAKPAGILQVTVKDNVSGGVVPGALLTLPDGRSGRTDGKGRLSLSLEPDQTSMLSISAEGYQSRQAKGSVSAGQTKRYVCQLKPLQTPDSGKDPRDPNNYKLPPGCVWGYMYSMSVFPVREKEHRKRVAENPKKYKIPDSMRSMKKINGEYEMHGPELHFHRNGRLSFVKYWENGQQVLSKPFRMWWSNGKLRESGSGWAKVGKKTWRRGVWREYREDGTLKYEYHHTTNPGVKDWRGGGPVKKIVFFDDSGDKWKEEYYDENGRLYKGWSKYDGWSVYD